MPWTPKITADFLGPVAANMLSAVTANQTSALNWANGGSGLEDFAAIYNSAYGRTLVSLPVLMLIEASTDEAEAPDEGLGLIHRLTFELYVAAATAELAQANVYKYVRAVDSIWREMANGQLTSGMTSNVGAAKVLSIGHRYAVQGARDNMFVNAARLNVVVQIVER